MTPNDISKLLAVIMHTWPNHRVDDPNVAIAAWQMVLGDVPYEAASKALTIYMRDGHEFAPNAGLLYQIIIDLLDVLPKPSEAWEIAMRRMRLTYPGHPAPPWEAPYPVRAAVKAMGGFDALRMSERPGADRHTFISEVYPMFRQRAIREVDIAALIEHGAKALEPGAGSKLLRFTNDIDEERA